MFGFHVESTLEFQLNGIYSSLPEKSFKNPICLKNYERLAKPSKSDLNKMSSRLWLQHYIHSPHLVVFYVTCASLPNSITR